MAQFILYKNMLQIPVRGGGIDPLQKKNKLISQATWWAERVADDLNRDENHLQAIIHWI